MHSQTATSTELLTALTSSRSAGNGLRIAACASGRHRPRCRKTTQPTCGVHTSSRGDAQGSRARSTDVRRSLTGLALHRLRAPLRVVLSGSQTPGSRPAHVATKVNVRTRNVRARRASDEGGRAADGTASHPRRVRTQQARFARLAPATAHNFAPHHRRRRHSLSSRRDVHRP